MLAGTDESPGKTLIKGGKKVKVIRGMAGYGANMSNKERTVRTSIIKYELNAHSRSRMRQGQRDDIFDVVPEGVEAVVPYRGPVEGIIKQLVGGLASGIRYDWSLPLCQHR